MNGNGMDPGPRDGGPRACGCERIASAVAELAAGSETCRADGASGLSRSESEHLAACEDCRALVAKIEPTLLFSVLALDTKDDAFWTGFETRILATIRETERERRGLLALLRPRAAMLASGAAMIAVLAVLTMETGLRGPAGPDSARQAHAVPGGGAGRSADVAAGNETASSPSKLGVASWERAPLLERDAATPSPVEAVSSSTAHVISIAIEDKDEGEADVVLIVDQGIDI